MDEFNAFVKKLVLHNKLAGDDQVELAEDMIEDGQNLARALVDIGALTEAKAAAVGNAWTKKTGKPVPGDDNGSAPAAASPAKASQRPKTARTAGGGGAKRSGGSIGKDVSGFRHLDEYFAYARELGASDLHIVVDNPPQIRQFGSLVNLNRAPFTATETERLLFEILRTDQAEALKEHLSIDFAYTDKTGRYRCCLVRQRNGWDGAFRLVADKVPSFDELGLPEQLRKLTEYHQGLILVTGPNGCGKSSTLAAMIDLVNQNRDDHIITIEDPVEYIFEPKRCHVSQREVGTHTNSFAAALRAALREDPDVIMIGELRDLETISLAITASETGHLVFGTLPTTSAPRTIDRLLDVFPPDEQAQIRSMISESIKGIVCQQLVPTADGKGRALAFEILFNTPAVGNIIRERKLHQIEGIMQTGKKMGMILLDNSLEDLVASKTVDGIEAWYAAQNKRKFEQYAPS